MKGWIKLKSKKILGLLLVITLLSASVFGSINVFAASGDTHVALESYMPPVKTLFVDENFENRGDVGTSLKNVASTYTYGTAGIEGTIEGDATNKYVSVASAWKSIFPKTDKYDSIRNAKTLVVSLSNMNTDTTANNAKFTIQLNETTVFLFEASSPTAYPTKNEIYNISVNGTQIATDVGVKDTTWNKIYVVLERVKDSAYVRKILIDGTDKAFYGKTFTLPDTALNDNWWGTKTPVRIRTGAATNCFDNILIYEPQTVYFKDVTQAGLTIVNDSSSEPVTGNLFLALYDTDGNLLTANPYGSDVTVAAGESQTITAPTGITYPEGIAKAKIFYWNGTTLAPLCYSADVPLS